MDFLNSILPYSPHRRKPISHVRDFVTKISYLAAPASNGFCKPPSTPYKYRICRKQYENIFTDLRLRSYTEGSLEDGG